MFVETYKEQNILCTYWVHNNKYVETVAFLSAERTLLQEENNNSKVKGTTTSTTTTNNIDRGVIKSLLPTLCRSPSFHGTRF